MTLKELTEKTSLKAIGRSIGLNVQMVDGHLQCKPLDPNDPRYSLDFVLPSMKMIDACRANDFDFFQPFISASKLTVEQMHRAAQRYFLGKTRSGQPIFWMIDDMLEPLDAHIGTSSWISTLLKARNSLLQYWPVHHCLFGLHLTSDFSHQTSPIAIVESETSAVVLSELFPESLWMAYVSISRTDPSLSTYLFFDDFADSIRKHLDIHLSVSSLLEDHATDSQKSRSIDLLDFIVES